MSTVAAGVSSIGNPRGGRLDGRGHTALSHEQSNAERRRQRENRKRDDGSDKIRTNSKGKKRSKKGRKKARSRLAAKAMMESDRGNGLGTIPTV